MAVDKNKTFLSQVGLETYHAKIKEKFQSLENDFTGQITGLGNVLRFEAELADDTERTALKLTESNKGEVYIVISTGKEWLWTGEKWIDLGTPYENVLKNKVDKVAGMGLSHNDFTDTHKTKLEGLPENLVNFNGKENSGLYKIKVDEYGRVTEAIEVTNDDISLKVNAISSADIDALEF